MTISNGPRPDTDYSRPAAGPTVVPLTPQPDVDRAGSIGSLVKEASVHMSTLIRSEIELAKLELTQSVKQAARGGGFFAAAAAIGLFSLFFFWLMIGEILDIWLPRWAAFVIVFVLMVIIAGALAFLGLQRFKKINKPERTIAELQQTAATLKQAAAPAASQPPASGQPLEQPAAS